MTKLIFAALIVVFIILQFNKFRNRIENIPSFPSLEKIDLGTEREKAIQDSMREEESALLEEIPS